MRSVVGSGVFFSVFKFFFFFFFGNRMEGSPFSSTRLRSEAVKKIIKKKSQ